MGDYIAGADRRQWAAGTYPGVWMGYIDVILAHTTETASWPGYNGNRYCPQATIDPKRRAVRQHYPVTMSARALVDKPGGVTTNRAHVFQTEIVGYSDRTIARSIGRDDLWVGNWGDAELGYLADVLAQVAGTQPVPWTIQPRYTRNPRYGTGAWQRMTFAEWRGFRGWCYHAGVPENSHWDSGALDLPRLMHLTRRRVDAGKDWYDMATKDDLRAVVREEVRDELRRIAKQQDHIADQQDDIHRTTKVAFARLRKVYRNLIEIPHGHMPEGSDAPDAAPADPGYE